MADPTNFILNQKSKWNRIVISDYDRRTGKLHMYKSLAYTKDKTFFSLLRPWDVFFPGIWGKSKTILEIIYLNTKLPLKIHDYFPSRYKWKDNENKKKIS